MRINITLLTTVHRQATCRVGFCPGGLRFRSILVKTHIITGPQPVADSVPGEGGAVLALGLRLQDLGEAGDSRDQRHQEHRGQHGGGVELGFGF